MGKTGIHSPRPRTWRLCARLFLVENLGYDLIVDKRILGGSNIAIEDVDYKHIIVLQNYILLREKIGDEKGPITNKSYFIITFQFHCTATKCQTAPTFQFYIWPHFLHICAPKCSALAWPNPHVKSNYRVTTTETPQKNQIHYEQYKNIYTSW